MLAHTTRGIREERRTTTRGGTHSTGASTRHHAQWQPFNRKLMTNTFFFSLSLSTLSIYTHTQQGPFYHYPAAPPPPPSPTTAVDDQRYGYDDDDDDDNNNKRKGKEAKQADNNSCCCCCECVVGGKLPHWSQSKIGKKGQGKKEVNKEKEVSHRTRMEIGFVSQRVSTSGRSGGWSSRRFQQLSNDD